MLAEWSAACGAEDPTVVVPWHDTASGLRFIDLRAEPYALGDVAEVEAWPELGRALRALNASRSPLLTAKCDAWPLHTPTAQPERDVLALELDLPAEASAFGYGCYIDLLWRERAVFTSAGQQQVLLDTLVRRLERLHHEQSAAECVLRPALLDFGAPLEGYAFTLYLRTLDSEAASARALWAAALDDVVGVLRSRAPGLGSSSATIDTAAALPLRVRHVR